VTGRRVGTAKARMKWVVDASAAAKWLAPEAESAQADALLVHDLFVPDLVFAEVANILCKKQSRGEIDDGVAVAAAAGCSTCLGAWSPPPR